jgi:hypothetical protein
LRWNFSALLIWLLSLIVPTIVTVVAILIYAALLMHDQAIMMLRDTPP